MSMTKRHEELLDQLAADPCTEIEVVRFTYNVEQLRVSQKITLRFSDGTILRRVPQERQTNPRLVNMQRSISDPSLSACSFNGISLYRLFQINNDGKFCWSLITTEKHAAADFDRFKRFIEKRIIALKKLAARQEHEPGHNPYQKYKIPDSIKQAIEKSMVITDESKKGEGVDPVHTPCRDCIFAKYEGKTQTGCAFNNRLEKFRELGAVVEVYDSHLEFSVINKRYCSAHRTVDWMSKVEVPSGRTITEVVRDQIAARIDYIVTVGQDTTEEQLEDSIQSIRRQTQKPHVVVVCSNQNKWKTSRLVTLMNRIGGELVWYVTNLLLRNDDGSLLPNSKAVDEAYHKCSGHLYVRIDAGTKLPKDIGKHIDDFVTDNLGQFAVLQAEETLRAEVVHSSFHRYAKGHDPVPVKIPGENGESIDKVLVNLPEKAQFYADAGNTNDMLRKVGDVCK